MTNSTFRTPHSAFRIRNTPHSGFTLIELIAVVLILGILAAAGAPSFTDSLMYHRVESAALRLKNDLELVQRMAVAQSTTFALEFTSATAYALPGIDSLDRVGEPYAVELAEPPYSVRVSSVDFGGLEEVRFNGFGLPTSGGTVVIAAGDHQRQISLNDQGRVTITDL